MGHVPILKPQEVIRILEAMGFAIIRQRGSHVQLRHVDGRRTTVPMHKGRDIAPGLLRKITSDIGLKIESFLQHR